MQNVSKKKKVSLFVEWSGSSGEMQLKVVAATAAAIVGVVHKA